MNLFQLKLERRLERFCIQLHRAQIWTHGSPGYVPCLQHEFREVEPNEWQWRLNGRPWRDCSAAFVEQHLEFAERAGFNVRWRVVLLAQEQENGGAA